MTTTNTATLIGAFRARGRRHPEQPEASCTAHALPKVTRVLRESMTTPPEGAATG
jgi:hypothetical protein